MIFKATKALITVIQYVPGLEGGAESLLDQGPVVLGCAEPGDVSGIMPERIQCVRAERGLRAAPLFLRNSDPEAHLPSDSDVSAPAPPHLF